MNKFNDEHPNPPTSGDEWDDRLEGKLRDALRLRSAPAGFTERTLRKIESAREIASSPAASAVPPRRYAWRSPAAPPWLGWGAAACLALSVVCAGVMQHEQARRAAGARARQQVLLALRITGTTLQDVRSKVDNRRSNLADEGQQ